ncbi:MAG: carboxypeptidase-like regulatory domain-containing protein, partial [Bacteroidota bacterium]|nr:carboxypeptidase-like regulatory domain-containing protein [Bacteroidota bacterium]
MMVKKEHIVLKLILNLVLMGSPFFIMAQQTASMSGRVIDKKDQSELIGVTVLIKGTSNGSTTDANGK